MPCLFHLPSSSDDSISPFTDLGLSLVFVMSAECERLHAVYRELAEAEIQKTTQYREKYIEQMNLAQTQKLMLQELEQRATEVV